MRLLYYRQDRELGVTDDMVDVNATRPYAILSHTWGTDEEEVSFEDLANNRGKDKVGYKKIQLCGEQAKRDGLQYFWVDTCCINKANKAEHSLAIRSMFRWYLHDGCLITSAPAATQLSRSLVDVSAGYSKSSCSLAVHWSIPGHSVLGVVLHGVAISLSGCPLEWR